VKLTRVVCISLALAVTAFGTLIWSKGYHGTRDFEQLSTALPLQETVVRNARSLRGAPYDPVKGGLGNIGSRLGFMVCADVPNLAFGLSGFSIKRMLEADFLVHPGAYDTSGGNRPGNPFFHRRARNMMSYFRANDRLVPPAGEPMVGDFVLYARHDGGPVEHVALVISADADQYRVFESAPNTIFAGEVDGTSPVRHGWVVQGIGRMYGPATR
jgi:hypothetical protein